VAPAPVRASQQAYGNGTNREPLGARRRWGYLPKALGDALTSFIVPIEGSSTIQAFSTYLSVCHLWEGHRHRENFIFRKIDVVLRPHGARGRLRRLPAHTVTAWRAAALLCPPFRGPRRHSRPVIDWPLSLPNGRVLETRAPSVCMSSGCKGDGVEAVGADACLPRLLRRRSDQASHSAPTDTDRTCQVRRSLLMLSRAQELRLRRAAQALVRRPAFDAGRVRRTRPAWMRRAGTESTALTPTPTPPPLKQALCPPRQQALNRDSR
jgi:hypothetical protein